MKRLQNELDTARQSAGRDKGSGTWVPLFRVLSDVAALWMARYEDADLAEEWLEAAWKRVEDALR